MAIGMANQEHEAEFSAKEPESNDELPKSAISEALEKKKMHWKTKEKL